MYIEKINNIMTISNYSHKTIELYTRHIKNFVLFCNKNDVNKISSNDVSKYMVHIKDDSYSCKHSSINSIKFFFKHYLKKEIKSEYFIRPIKPKKLPIILSKEEVISILNVCNNIKHKTIIFTLYDCGLRLSELLNLKISDIDSKNNLIFINQGKGKKDRYIPLSNSLLLMLREYYKIYKPKIFLFNGDNNEKYSQKSVQLIIKKYANLAKITKRVYPHLLRHSCLSHLLSNKTNLRYVQEIAGHSSIKTTQRYLHIDNKEYSKIETPLFDVL